MDINEVTKWFTSTIPGIVFLGALGSLLAIPLAKPTKLILLKVLPLLWRLPDFILEKKVKREAEFLDLCQNTGDVNKLIINCVYNLTKFVGSVFIILLISIYLAYSFGEMEEIKLTWKIFVLVAIAIAFLFNAFVEFMLIWGAHYMFCSEAKQSLGGPPIKEMIDNFLKDSDGEVKKSSTSRKRKNVKH